VSDDVPGNAPDNVVPLEREAPDAPVFQDDTTARRPVRGLPGCGLALFTMLLGVFFCMGVSGHGVTLWAVFSSADALRSSKLVYGGNVDPRTLAPMRDAGGLRQEEVPDAFHAETLDGTKACAISEGRVIRVEGGEITKLPLAEVQRVAQEEGAVAVYGKGASIVCAFGPDEGAERFARMVQTAAKPKAEPGK
jgi:hypothetical protein